MRIDVAHPNGNPTETGPGPINLYAASPLLSTNITFQDDVDVTTEVPLTLHLQDQIGRHERAEPEPPDPHAVTEEVLHDNKPDVSKILLAINVKIVVSFLEFSYRSPGTSPGLPFRLKVMFNTVCIAFIVLLTGISLRGWRPGAAKVMEKAGQIVSFCWFFLLMSLFVA